MSSSDAYESGLSDGEILDDSLQWSGPSNSLDGSFDDVDMDEQEYIYWGSPLLPPVEAVQVSTGVVRSQCEVRRLVEALYNGYGPRGCLPLPLDVVSRIVRMADYTYVVEKKASSGFQGEEMHYCLFEFGPLPFKPYKVEIEVESHDQGWSIYPEDRQTTRNAWTWAEVDVKDGGKNGVSKLDGPKRVFTNIHADASWQKHLLKYENDEFFMNCLKSGDIIELTFRSASSGWVIYVKNAKMTVYFQVPPLASTSIAS